MTTTASDMMTPKIRQPLRCLWLCAGAEWEQDYMKHLLQWGNNASSIRRLVAPKFRSTPGMAKSSEEREAPLKGERFECVIWSVLAWSPNEAASISQSLTGRRVLVVLGDEQSRPSDSQQRLAERRKAHEPMMKQFRLVMRQYMLGGPRTPLEPPVFFVST